MGRGFNISQEVESTHLWSQVCLKRSFFIIPGFLVNEAKNPAQHHGPFFVGERVISLFTLYFSCMLIKYMGGGEAIKSEWTFKSTKSLIALSLWMWCVFVAFKVIVLRWRCYCLLSAAAQGLTFCLHGGWESKPSSHCCCLSSYAHTHKAMNDTTIANDTPPNSFHGIEWACLLHFFPHIIFEKVSFPSLL